MPKQQNSSADIPVSLLELKTLTDFLAEEVWLQYQKDEKRKSLSLTGEFSFGIKPKSQQEAPKEEKVLHIQDTDEPK